MVLAKRAVVTAVLLVATSGVQPRAQAPAPAAVTPLRPRLVVMLVADQFRADYVSLYSEAWTAGLKELVTRGAFFAEAAYPYAITRTCAGHGTIGTGLLPSTHGFIDNSWYERSSRSFVACTADDAARPLGFGGGPVEEQHSARRMVAPTFADELRRQFPNRPRVVSLSLKARSAIGMAGHGGPDTTIVWKEDGGATFATSSALTKRASPAVEAYVRAHPVGHAQFQTWDRLKPASSYKFTDEAAGEPAGRRTFPHVYEVPIRTSNATPSVYDSWDNTPFTDDYLAGMAEHLIEAERLGQRQTTDLLAVSFSALDIVGHDFGPRSHEVQDVLLRLDAVIGRLLATLDAKVGRERYVVAFTSDHGVAMLPEQSFPVQPGGRGGAAAQRGRLTNISVANAVEAALDKVFGPGHYVEAVSSPYLYFEAGVLDRIRGNAAARQAVEAAVVGVRGIDRAVWTSDLVAATDAGDPLLLQLRRSFMADRSGDLAFVMEPNWVNSGGTNHGTPQDYDRRVPLALLGAGIKAGRFSTPASPVDIAPTLAAITGVRLPRTDGRVLTDALVR